MMKRSEPSDLIPLPLAEPAQQWWLNLAVPVLVWLTCFAVILLPIDFHIGFDAYYHTQLSEMMVKHGLFLKEFPWATESMWTDAWFDKEWLFHVMLIPFLGFGRDLGPKLYTLCLIAGIVLSLGYMLKGAGVSSRSARFWLSIMPFASTGIFFIRMSTCRPHLLSLIILALALGAMLRRQAILLAVFSAIYAVSYTGYWQLLGLVLLYDLGISFLESNCSLRKKPLMVMPMLLPTFGGMVVGTLFHPNFPNNMYGLYVQNVVVLLDAWTAEVNPFFNRPQEFQAAGLKLFVVCLPVFAISVLAAAVAFRRKLRLNRSILLFAVYTLGYGLMFFKSVRFIEYFLPVSICFLAVFVKRHPLPRLCPNQMLHKWGSLAIIVAALGYTWFGYKKSSGFRFYYWKYIARAHQMQEGTHRYAKAGAWLNTHLEPGERVFSTQWDANSILWFHAPQLKYPVFLDPMFMAQRDPDRYRLFTLILSGQHPDPVTAIINQFNSRTVYLSPQQSEFAAQLDGMGHKHVFQGKTMERIYLLAPTPVYIERDPPAH